VAQELPVPEEIRNGKYFGMNSFSMHSELKLSDLYEVALRNNKFRWRGLENRIIIPRVWSQVLQPDWTIRLEFEDERLNDGHSKQLEQTLKASRLGEASTKLQQTLG
jgi:hypothetical protein